MSDNKRLATMLKTLNESLITATFDYELWLRIQTGASSRCSIKGVQERFQKLTEQQQRTYEASEQRLNHFEQQVAVEAAKVGLQPVVSGGMYVLATTEDKTENGDGDQ